MDDQLKKYEGKILDQRLAHEEDIRLGLLDLSLRWNRQDNYTPHLEGLFDRLSITSLLHAQPAGPLGDIIEHMAGRAGESLVPADSETRTFLHSIPVVKDIHDPALPQALGTHRAVVTRQGEVLSHGSLTAEQAFISFSSVCFALFVSFYSDLLVARLEGKEISHEEGDLAKRGIEEYMRYSDPGSIPEQRAPFSGTDRVIRAMDEAGRLTVRSGMVDSFFGNISCIHDGSVFISQTGASLDELPGHIDICPLDDSMTTAITASSEFGAHRSVYEKRQDVRTILHGHPRFTVILSMACTKKDCPNRGRCHVACREEREMAGIPIVPGEVGTGPTGLINTLPPALSGQGAIVWGHGLFCVGKEDYTDAFLCLRETEKKAVSLYIEETGLSISGSL
jgi:ribulose-5-phosphate 4-epimerase/fuculose-1-phosphate aldolase